MRYSWQKLILSGVMLWLRSRVLHAEIHAHVVLCQSQITKCVAKFNRDW